MNTRKIFGYGTRNLFCAIAVVFVLAFAACPDGSGGNDNNNGGNDGGGGGNGGSGSYAMVRVPGGSFQMGNPDSSVGYSAERPVHTVTLSGFYMGKCEVTQAQYRAVTGNNPSYFKGDNLPVEQVTWYDAVEFCNKLSEREGRQPVYTISGRSPSSGYPITFATVTANWSNTGYRLPTEAQWEYAAKGGNGSPGNYLYAGSNTVGEVAWYSSNSNFTTHTVGTKSPNGLGIYDMSGNVWEWCWDWYSSYTSGAQTDPEGASSGADRVRRGGYWGYSAEYVRSANRRNGSYPNSRGNDIGVRLARPAQ